MLDIVLLPELRDQEQSGGIHVRSGGSAANTAAWIAALGSSVTFVGCVGDDAIGTVLIEELRRSGVRPKLRVVNGVETGAVAVHVSHSGERSMRSARGANEALAPTDLRAIGTMPLSLVHLTGYALLGPHRFELLQTAGEVARRADALLTFDPSSSGVIHFLGVNRLLEEMMRSGVDVLLPNREEAEAMCGGGTTLDVARRLCTSVPRVVVKDGSCGACWAEAGAAGEVPTQAVTPIDTTGAGDAFNAGILASLAAGRTLADACAEAHTVARQAVAHYGGRPSITSF